jgi:hypothetical protein
MTTATPERLREIALGQLQQMYVPDARAFVFRRRRQDGSIVAEGLSHRYTAITALGLAGEAPATVSAITGRDSLRDVCRDLVARAESSGGVGDVALVCWASHAAGYGAADSAWRRLTALGPVTMPVPVVELAWALSALSLPTPHADRELRDNVATRLMRLYNDRAGAFPHEAGAARGSRAHVSCFADQVYPILALAQYGAAAKDVQAIEIASRTAARICRAQGADGQWWWHYDARVDALVERYPVYSVHQHAMAPMALKALEPVAGLDFSEPIERGLRWLSSAPELDGGTLIDDASDTIWRKVGRREPGKAARYLQALATRLSPGATWPGLDTFLPPGSVDYECRPYEFGWLLYAWPRRAPAGVAGAPPRP